MFISVYATLRQSTLITIGNNVCVFAYIEERKNAVGRGQLIFFLMQKLNYCDNYFDFFFLSKMEWRCFIMNYPGLHTAPISNMVGTEELILLHSVSKATLPTQNQRQYAQLQILRHWCKFFLTNWSSRLYDYLLAISQAIELYRLALFSLLFFFFINNTYISSYSGMQMYLYLLFSYFTWQFLKIYFGLMS